jgi:tetratricopeptide (TPR) repeat protein
VLSLFSALVVSTALAGQATITTPPQDALGVYARGVAAAKAGDWQTTITLMNAAIAIDPAPRTYGDGGSERDYYPQYYLFIAHSELGEYDQALRFYLTKGGFPQRLAPDGEHALAKLSATIPRTSPPPSQPAQAASQPVYYSSMLKAPPQSVLVTYSDGVRAMAAEKSQEAIAAFTKAISLDPVSRSFREGVLPMDYYPQYYLFVAYLKAGDLAKARQYYESRGNLPSKFTSDARRYSDELAAAEKRQ